ncbi:MAG TPA: nickel-responsive transcriptional regulator NikR [Burkholderiaceae bacterium]|nr:nickel-responsive transcriptional regulator NikR [Burkholderiaceae bacterium]
MERFTVSLEERLAREFDGLIARRGYASRSEAVRDLLRAELERTSSGGVKARHCVAALSYVYNHQQRDLAERLTLLQHNQHDLVISSMHAHLDHEHCLETVLLRGESDAVQRFADGICAETGVHHGKLNLISVEVHQRHRNRGAAGKRQGAGHGTSAQHVHLKPSH